MRNQREPIPLISVTHFLLCIFLEGIADSTEIASAMNRMSIDDTMIHALGINSEDVAGNDSDGQMEGW